MPVTPASLIELFPAFTSFSTASLQAAINVAERANSGEMWGDLRDDAVTFYAAMVASSGPAAAAAVAAGIQSATAGPVSVTFGSGGGSGGAGGVAANAYEALWQRTLRTRIPGFIVL